MSHSIIETVIQHELERWAQLGPQCEITMSCGFPICRVGDRCLQREVSQTNLVSPTLPIREDEESTWQRFMHLLILFDPFCPVQLSPTILYSRIIDYAIMQHVTVYMFHDVSQGCLQLCTVPQKCPSFLIALGIEAHTFAWCPWRWRGRMGHSPGQRGHFLFKL